MLKVKINGASGFSGSNLKKLNDAVQILERVVNSPEFKEKVLNYKWKTTYTTGKLWWKSTVTESGDTFRYNNNLTNQQVLDSIMSGAEVLSPEKDHEIDIDIAIAYTRGSVIGYTYSNTLKTWIASWFVSQEDAASIAGNLFHEWLHKLGFDHEYYFNPLREFTVCYALGYEVERMGKQLSLGNGA